MYNYFIMFQVYSKMIQFAYIYTYIFFPDFFLYRLL